MENSISFTILGAPMSLKNQKKIGKRRMYNSSEYQAWAQSFALQIPADVRGLCLGGRAKPKGPATLLRAIVSVWYADWRPDVDVEGIWDILQTMRVVENDRWIREKHIYGAHVDAVNPRVEITIEEL